ARRALSLRHEPHRGTVVITVELPVEMGELVDQALDRALEAAVSSKPGPEEADESWSARRADALVTLAKAYLGGQQSDGAGVPHPYQVTVHVEESALRGGAGRAGLPIETVRRIACDSDLVVVVEDRNGEPLSVGRKTRTVPAAIHRALWARDGGCRFPGCGRKRFLEAHHAVHWADGGETSLSNLLLLCTKHHTLLHEGRFTLEKDDRGRWFFRLPDGRALPECGYRPEDVTDDGAGSVEEYFDAVGRGFDSDASAEVTSKPSEGALSDPSAQASVNASAQVLSGVSAETPSDASAEALRDASAEVLRDASAETLSDASAEACRHASAEVLARSRSIGTKHPGPISRPP
ncbi:MAG TPA: DUF222 domain-containing protein, partial [Gammaproteobacteria bacterium]